MNFYHFDILKNQEPGKGGEIHLTDALKTLADQEAIYAYDFALKRDDFRDGLMDFFKNKEKN